MFSLLFGSDTEETMPQLAKLTFCKLAYKKVEIAPHSLQNKTGLYNIWK